MVKKIIFGAIISAILLVSMQFIAPINVKAAETNKEEILEATNNLANALQNDDLYKIVSGEKAKSIVRQIRAAETNQEITQLIEQYTIFIREKYSEELTRLQENSATHDAELKQLLKEFSFSTAGEDEKSTSYIKITKTNDKLTVTKTNSAVVGPNDILYRTNDGAMKTKEYNWIDSDTMDELSDFFWNLAIAIAVIGAPVVIIISLLCLGLCEILEDNGFTDAAWAVGKFAINVLFVYIGLAGGCFVLSVIFNSLSNVAESSKTKAERFSSKIHLFFEKIIKFMQSFRLKVTA